VEKSLVVEVKDADQARLAARAGVDVLQFDKFSPAELRERVAEIHACCPRVRLLAAGGIGLGNIADYATGVDGLVLSSIYRAEPADIGVRLAPLS
jgi:molybdenum transport protein